MSDAKYRERPTCKTCGSALPFPPDPPLGEPYPGYSMMEMLRLEGAGTHPVVRPKPPAPTPIKSSTPKKKKKSRRR